MKIVSNASPLINLARISQLGLLHQLYGQLIIPEAVWREVVMDGVGQPGAAAVEAAAWIETQAATNSQLVQALRQELDAGEAEAIVLALEVDADLLLMDERVGRETARFLNQHCIGLVGILIAAKHKQLIPSIRPFLDELRNTAGFRLSQSLYLQVLQDEGEA